MAKEYGDNAEKRMSIFINNFTPDQLDDYENQIFSEKIDKKKRAELEFSRLKLELSKNLKLFSDYYSELNEIARLLKVVDLSSDIIEDIYRRIVRIQLSNNMDIRLYSAFELIRIEEEVKQLRKKAGEVQNGTKFNR